MNRKWTMLAVVTLTTAMVASTAALADDKEGPLHKLMESVNKSNSAIRKAVRTPVEYKKSVKKVEEDARELVKLGKEARPLKDAVSKKTPPHETWVKLMDEFISASEELEKVAAKGAETQAQAKEAFTKLGATCTKCHNDYRVEE